MNNYYWFDDELLACCILEDEGFFDTRTREEKIETVIQKLLRAGGSRISATEVAFALIDENLDDATTAEIKYVISEVELRQS